MRRPYAKLDIHKKQELLDLFEDLEAAKSTSCKPAGFPSCCSRHPRAGRFSEFASLRAAFRAPRGRFSELLRRRARVLGFRWQVSRVAVANYLHAGSESRETCQRSPVSVHGDSESRETRHTGTRGVSFWERRPGNSENPPHREAAGIDPYDTVIALADRTNWLLDFNARLASSRGGRQVLFKLETAMQVLPELPAQCPKRARTCYSVGFTTVSCILKGVTPRTLCGLPAVMTMLWPAES